jgi:hypothetical protein
MMSDQAKGTSHEAIPDSRRIARGLGAIGMVLASAGLLAAGEEPRPASGFSAQVEAHFGRWDLDRDGALSFLETSRLVPDVSTRDEAAAALAAVHLAQRGERWYRATFARDVLIATPDDEPGRQPPFETYYRMGLAHIRATDRALFAGGGPNLRSFHQGLLGDCYFVATLGALVSRDPAVVGRIVRQGPDGSFDIRFPDGEPVRVRHISDAEVALGSYDGGQGLWLNVLEKGYGQLVERSLARRGICEDAIDALGDGGRATGAMTLFTGNDAAVLRFRPDDPLVIPGDRRVAGFLPLTRALLISNFRRRRLTCCGTTEADTPPGIAKRHLYAVLGFDPAGDLVQVWNPWGNHFEPRGAPGLGSGYPVRQGHFTVPLGDFIRIFDSVIYETDRPASLW